MLTAEENIVLPLSIAGEKPDQAWLERADRDGRPRATGARTGPRSSPAASSSASRSRGRWSRSPTVLFADEPTGNLDSNTSGEVLALLRHSVDELGQTTVMVTHDARAAAIADRILFLADGDDRPGRSPRSDRPHVIARDGGDRPPMIAVALKGLCGRKLRALLTALAIVLGVAMVSGTFILTDTITHAFDAIFSSSYEETDASITGKRRSASTRPPTCRRSRRVAARRRCEDLPGVAGRRSAASPTTAKLVGTNGKAIGFGGAPQLGFGVDPTQARFNPLTLIEGAWPGGRTRS